MIFFTQILKKFIFQRVIIFIFFVGAIFVYMHQGKDYPITNAKTVHIIKEQNSFQLIRNGKPFYIKGASGKSYIKELSEAGGNTLRLYDTINLQKILDEATKYNIAVIVDIPLPRFNNYVNFYRNGEFIYRSYDEPHFMYRETTWTQKPWIIKEDDKEWIAEVVLHDGTIIVKSVKV